MSRVRARLLSGLVRGEVANPLCVVGKYRARLQAVTLLPFTAVCPTPYTTVLHRRESAPVRVQDGAVNEDTRGVRLK